MGAKLDKSSRKSLSEINMTPFVDIVLVLLVIFMVTAPLMQNSLDIDLPKSKGSSTKRAPSKPLTITVKKNKKIRYAGSSHTLDSLSKKLENLSDKQKNKAIYLQADKSVPYGFVAEVLGEIKAAGLNQISLVTISK